MTACVPHTVKLTNAWSSTIQSSPLERTTLHHLMRRNLQPCRLQKFRGMIRVVRDAATLFADEKYALEPPSLGMFSVLVPYSGNKNARLLAGTSAASPGLACFIW